MAPIPIPKSKKEKNVAFAIPFRLPGALSTAHACNAGCTVPKPNPYNAPAIIIIVKLGSQDNNNIAIKIKVTPGGMTYKSPLRSYIFPANIRDNIKNKAYEIK